MPACNSTRPTVSARIVLTTRSVTAAFPRPLRTREGADLIHEDYRRRHLVGAGEEQESLGGTHPEPLRMPKSASDLRLIRATRRRAP